MAKPPQKKTNEIEYPKVYLNRAGKYGEDEEYALENGLTIIGQREYSSLDDCKTLDDVDKLVRKVDLEQNKQSSNQSISMSVRQLWKFARLMAEGDIVVLPRKNLRVIALGKIAGPYKYQEINGELRHTREVKWVRRDIPRSEFKQDLLYSLGSLLTICRITRNDAERRINTVFQGKPDPGPAILEDFPGDIVDEQESPRNLSQFAEDQITAHIQSNFAGHSLANLVDAVLKAEGWVTKVSKRGPDGGVDIFAGRGHLGLDSPRLCVQVKSQDTPCDVGVYRGLLGSISIFNANQGLLVCWGGFNDVVLKEAKQGHFEVRLWRDKDLVEAIYRNYDRLSSEIKAKLPLRQTWTLVIAETDE